jgi:hypothetical protein
MIQATLKFDLNEDNLLRCAHPEDVVLSVLHTCRDIMSELWLPVACDEYIKTLKMDLLRQFIYPSFTRDGIQIIRECFIVFVTIRYLPDSP